MEFKGVAAVAIGVSIILSACGGGGNEPATPCAPTIQLFGDSTMAPELGAGPLWIAKWGPRVTNRAVGGTNSTALRTGTDGLNAPWPMSVNADYVVINHGMRDGFIPFPQAFTPLEQYKDNLRFFRDHNGGAEVIFQTPNPSTILPERDMAPYAAAMKEVAAEKGNKVIDVYACFQQQPNWEQRIPDKTHPDQQGLQYVVDTCVTPVVEALTCKK